MVDLELKSKQVCLPQNYDEMYKIYTLNSENSKQIFTILVFFFLSNSLHNKCLKNMANGRKQILLYPC